MIINLFRAKRPGLQTFVVLVMLLVAFVPVLVNGVEVTLPEGASPVYRLFAEWFISLISWLQFFLVAIMTLIIVFLLLVVYRQSGRQFGKPAVPVFVTIMILVAFPGSIGFHPVMLSMLFFVPSLANLLSSLTSEANAFRLFSAGFFLSMGSLFYPVLLLLFPSLFVVLMIFSLFRWRLWGAALTGLLLPWIYYVVIFWVLDSSEWVFPLVWWSGYFEGLQGFDFLKSTSFGMYDILMYSLTTVLIAISAITVYRKLDQSVVYHRLMYKALLWMVTVVLLLIVASDGVLYPKMMLCSFFPVFVVSDYLQWVRKPKVIDYLLFLILFAFIAGHLNALT